VNKNPRDEEEQDPDVESEEEGSFYGKSWEKKS